MPQGVVLNSERRLQVDNALITTKAIRRRLDLSSSVDHTLVREALSVARYAPSGGAEQPVRWLVVADPERIAAAGEAYRSAYLEFDRDRAGATDDTIQRVRDSSAYLADVMSQVPILISVCSAAAAPVEPAGPEAAKFYGSIYPAVWSFQVALRARGLGSCMTTIGLRQRDEIARAIGVPNGWTQCAHVPVAQIRGETLRPASRKPTVEVVKWI